jgi:hypothetical protein
MTAYRRKNHAFNSRLAVRRDELQAATVNTDERGQVTITCIPYLIFPNQDTAQRFLQRVTTRTRRSQQ